MANTDFINKIEEMQAEASAQLDSLRKQISRFRDKADVLEEMVRAYNTILRTQALVDSDWLELRSSFDELLLGNTERWSLGPDTEGQTVEGGEVAQPAAASRMPNRRPEFSSMTNRQALETLLTHTGFQGESVNNDYASAIWDIQTDRERFYAKRTLNGELSRAVASGLLRRVDGKRGRYAPASWQALAEAERKTATFAE